MLISAEKFIAKFYNFPKNVVYRIAKPIYIETKMEHDSVWLQQTYLSLATQIFAQGKSETK